MRRLVLIGLLLGFASVASATTNITGCQTLAKPGELYVLQQDIEIGAETCFLIGASGVTLDLNNHVVTGDFIGTGVSEAGRIWRNVTIRNGGLFGLGEGIDMPGSVATTVRNVGASFNTNTAISVGPRALVTGVQVLGNGGYGVILGASATLRESEVQSNLIDGVLTGPRALVTQNVIAEHERGVVVGEHSVVTNNIIGLSVTDGVVALDYGTAAAGSLSQISGNTFYANDVDVRVDCPATVTNNVGQQAPVSIVTEGAGCQITGNH